MMLWCALALAQQPIALDDRLDVDVAPLGDGFVRAGQATALSVSAANLGPGTTATVSVEVEGALGTSRRLALPRGADKTVSLWIPTIPRAAREAIVRLETDDERREEDISPLRLIGEDDVLIGVIGEGFAGINGLTETWTGPTPGHPGWTAEQARPVHTALLEEEHLPDQADGYAAFDLLVWLRPDPTSWSPERVEALGLWVARGGTLLVSLPDGGQRIADSLAADWLGVRAGSVEDVDASALGALCRCRASGTVPVAKLPPRPDATRLRAVLLSMGDGTELWSQSSYGLGQVGVLAFDPTGAPFSESEARRALWRTLLELPPAEEGWAWMEARRLSLSQTMAWGDLARVAGRARLAEDSPLKLEAPWKVPGYVLPYQLVPEYLRGEPTHWQATAWQLGATLAGLPPQDPFPWAPVLGFFAVGGLWVGLGERLLLGLLRRRRWALWVWPLSLTALSAGAVFGAHQLLRDAGSLDQVEVVDLLPGTRLWRGTTVARVHATHGAAIVLRPRVRDALIGPVWGDDSVGSLQMGEEVAAFTWSPQPWATARVQAVWQGRSRGAVRVTPLAEGGWRVDNDLPVDLHDGLIWLPDGYVRVGEIASGQSLTLAEQSLVTEAQGPIPGVVWSGGGTLQRAAKSLWWYAEPSGGHLDPQLWVEAGHGVFFGFSDEALAPLASEGPHLHRGAATVVRAPFYLP